MAEFKQSTIAIHQFTMVLSSDHTARATGKSTTFVIKLGKNGATGVTASSTALEVDAANLPGVYSTIFNATDTNTVGSLAFAVTGTGCDPTNEVHQVRAQVVTDIMLDASGNVSIASSFKQNQATTLPFVMTITGTNTIATGKTVSGQRNFGAGYSSISGSIAELGNGGYQATLLAADMNASVIFFRFTATGCNDQDITIYTQP